MRSVRPYFEGLRRPGMLAVKFAEDLPMNATVKSLGIDRLGLDEKLALVEEIWDTIALDDTTVPMTAAQQAELEHRRAEDDANPNDTVAWEHAKSETIARLNK